MNPKSLDDTITPPGSLQAFRDTQDAAIFKIMKEWNERTQKRVAGMEDTTRELMLSMLARLDKLEAKSEPVEPTPYALRVASAIANGYGHEAQDIIWQNTSLTSNESVNVMEALTVGTPKGLSVSAKLVYNQVAAFMPKPEPKPEPTYVWIVTSAPNSMNYCEGVFSCEGDATRRVLDRHVQGYECGIKRHVIQTPESLT